MSKKKTADSGWQHRWLELQRRLAGLGDDDFDLHHEVIITERGLGTNPELIADRLWKAAGRQAFEHISVQRNDPATEEHFFYGIDRKTFDAFSMALVDVDRLLAKIPSGLMPKVGDPGLEGRSRANLISWIRLMYYLAWRVPKHTLRAELWCSFEAIDGSTPVEWTRFDEVQRLPEFDPYPFVSGIGPTDRTLEFWRTKHQEAGLRFPSMLNAHFDKNLFYASANAIDVLLLQASASSEPKPRAKRKTTTAENLKFLTFEALLAHHQPFSKSPCDTALKQEDLAEKLEWSTRKATEGMQKWFEGGIVQYRRLCEEGQIASFLQAKDLKEIREWAVRNNIDLNRIAGLDRRASDDDDR